jgi:zinc protease
MTARRGGPGSRGVPGSRGLPASVGTGSRAVPAGSGSGSRAAAAGPAPLSPSRPWSRVRAPSGLRVAAATLEEAPLLRLRLAFAAGAQFDPPGKEGLASLATPLLRVGSMRLDDRALTTVVEQFGTDLVTAVDWELGSLTIDLLPRHLDRALALLFDLTRPPEVHATAFDRARHTRLLQLHGRPNQPAVLATDWLARAIYGQATYGVSLLGSVRGLTALTYDDVRAFYARRIDLATACLVAVGPVRIDDLLTRLDAALGRQSSTSAPATATAHSPAENGPLVPIPAIAPRTRTAREICIVDLPSAARTELRLGHLGIAQSHPDLPDLEIVNAILGGSGACSRLHRVLREQHGFSYSVHSRVVGRRAAGPFLVATCVRHDVVGAAVGLVLDEIHALREQAVSPDEIAIATGALTLARLQTRTSVRALADHLSFLEAHDLRDDTDDAWQRPRDIDPARVADLAGRHLHPDRIVVVAVGPARVLRKQLEQFGAVIEVDPTALEVQHRVA